MTSLAVDVSLDELRKFVPKFFNATTLEIGNELKRQAGLLVRGNSGFGLLSITPPKGIDEGQKIGERSVQNDIFKVMVSREALVSAMKAVSDRGAVSAFNRYIRQGKYEEAKQFINGQKSGTVSVKGYSAKRHGKTVNVRPYTQSRDVSALNIPRLGSVQSISQVPQASLHRMRRRKAGENSGRVLRESWAQVVLRRPALKQYIDDRRRRVGLLKAAWAKAAQDAGLGVSIPQYVRRNIGQAKGKGSKSFANPLNMYVELANNFDVASLKIERGDIEFVISTRQENIFKELENRLGKLAAAA